MSETRSISTTCAPPQRGIQRLAPSMHRALLRFTTFAALIAASTCRLTPAFAQWSLFPNTHDLGLASEFKPPRVFGDRVMMLLEARSHPWRLPDSAAKDVNVRGYLLSARFTDQVGATCRVIGPLYRIEGPMSSLTSAAGAAFTDDDQKALTQKPRLELRAPGVLVRSIVVREEKSVHESVLSIEDSPARWAKTDKRPLLPLLGWSSSNYAESSSHHYAMQMEPDGKVRIYDKATGREIEDRWLQSVFAEYFSRDDLGNSKVFLPDDLRYVVIFLEPTYNFTRNGKATLIENFAFEGKSLRRENHFLVYKRPNERAELYEERDARSFPVVFGGELLMFKLSGNRLSLENLKKQTVIAHEMRGTENWIRNAIRADIPAEKRIVFTSGPGLITGSRLDRPDDGTVRIAIWDYKNNAMSQYTVPVADHFELKTDGYYPKDAIPIAK